jgi:hypothetical protein
MVVEKQRKKEQLVQNENRLVCRYSFLFVLVTPTEQFLNLPNQKEGKEEIARFIRFTIRLRR